MTSRRSRQRRSVAAPRRARDGAHPVASEDGVDSVLHADPVRRCFADRRRARHARCRRRRRPAAYDQAAVGRRDTGFAVRAERPVAPPLRRRARASSGAAASAQSRITEHSVRNERDGRSVLAHAGRRHRHPRPSLTRRPQGLDAARQRPQPGQRHRGRDGAAQPKRARTLQRRSPAPHRLRRQPPAPRRTRWPLYAQDEWNIDAALGGARRPALGRHHHARHRSPTAPAPRNRSSVWTPLLHAVWKPDPKGRDQVRMSLTRSYRAPTLQNLIGAAERQHALPGAGRRTRRPAPTAPATRTSSPNWPPASTSPSSATSPAAAC